VKTDREWLTVSELAAHLRCSTRSVWRHVARGLLPQPVRLTSRLVRWRVADVRRCLEAAAR
jgi:predicted DNA-binding transcriptional regulator AlpA